MAIPIFIISAFLCYFFLILSRNYFLKNKIVDKINERSSHDLVATRTGGIGIFISILLISTYYYIRGITVYDFSILIPLIILLLIGVYDDSKNADYKLKFIFQIIAAKIIIDNGLIIDNFHGIFGIDSIDRIPAQIFTIFIILSIINSVNFIDGIDGLASSVILIFIVLFEILSIGQSNFYFLSITIIPCLSVFIYFNFQKKRKIFLGDSGSLFLGGLASIYILEILSSNYLIIDKFDINKVFYVFSVFSYPIVDITRVVLLRISKRRSPFQADKNHIHHVLLQRFKSHKKVLALIIFTQILTFILIHTLFNI